MNVFLRYDFAQDSVLHICKSLKLLSSNFLLEMLSFTVRAPTISKYFSLFYSPLSSEDLLIFHLESDDEGGIISSGLPLTKMSSVNLGKCI